MARWQRASNWLTLPPGSRVLDLGCAFGFGTRLLARRFETYGHDLDERYIERARENVPHATFTVGPASQVPYPDAYFDAVVCLDVLEHVPDDAAVVAEVARLLRPGGTLILSTPNRTLVGALDSLNLYQNLAHPDWPSPTDDPSWPATRRHRHYSASDVDRLLGGRFIGRQAVTTGLGLAEPINLVLLLLFRAISDWPSAYRAAQYLYFGVYLLEDLLPMGSHGYHLTLAATRR